MIRKDKARDYVKNGLLKHPKYLEAEKLKKELIDTIVKKCNDALTDREKEYINAGYPYKKQRGLDNWSFIRLLRLRNESVENNFYRIDDYYTNTPSIEWLRYFNISVPENTPYCYNFGTFDGEEYFNHKDFVDEVCEKAKDLWNIINNDLKDYVVQTYNLLTSDTYDRKKLETEHPELLCES